MKSTIHPKLFIAASTLLAFTASLRGQATTPTVSTVYSFTGTRLANPAGLIEGSDGNFYGTTSGFGSDSGTIYRITSAGEYTAFYSFKETGTDGG